MGITSICYRFFERCIPKYNISRDLHPYMANQPHKIVHYRTVKAPLDNPTFVGMGVFLLRKVEGVPFKKMKVNKLLRYIVLSSIGGFGGYLVSFHNGSYLIAFASVLDAVSWCMYVQEILLNVKWRTETSSLSDVDLEEIRSPNGSLLFCGLRVRMAIHRGEAHSQIDSRNNRMAYSGECIEATKTLCLWAHGGQIILSEVVWCSIKEHLSQLGNAVLEDLGQYRLFSKTIKLVQILPLSLVDRIFQPLLTPTQVSLGMRDAPAPTSHLTIVFTYIEGLKQMILEDVPLTVKWIDRFCYIVRKFLLECQGYECQELRGEFMLAFQCSSSALLWSVLVQQQLQLLSSTDKEFSKFSVSIGMECGIPVSVSPHRTSGRADYFGSIVNLTSRIASVAYGGQILLGPQALAECLGQDNEHNSRNSIASTCHQGEDSRNSIAFTCHQGEDSRNSIASNYHQCEGKGGTRVAWRLLGQYHLKGLNEVIPITEAWLAELGTPELRSLKARTYMKDTDSIDMEKEKHGKENHQDWGASHSFLLYPHEHSMNIRNFENLTR